MQHAVRPRRLMRVRETVWSEQLQITLPLPLLSLRVIARATLRRDGRGAVAGGSDGVLGAPGRACGQRVTPLARRKPGV